MLDPETQKLVERASDMKRAGVTMAQIASETGLDRDYLMVVLRGVKGKWSVSPDALNTEAINTIIRDRLAGRSRKAIAKDWLISTSSVSRYTKHVAHLIPKPQSKKIRPFKAAANARAREQLDKAIIERVMAFVPRAAITAEFGVSRMKIIRVIRKYGVTPPRAVRPHPREAEILAAYDACQKPFRVAEQLGVDRTTVHRALKRREKIRAAANTNTLLEVAA